ncbi:GmrSD restriction endonuclease domain-containing protein [Thermaerobacter marianensis]|uniref:GmrSD restriction endonuclease domain-containing protein n=1 Tax=Thermaerobacter marianensis TaxID=73919 RepID=UPI00145D5E06|nr:DUF262 domain-containing protein [Thermaerobacter marianensis]
MSNPTIDLNIRGENVQELYSWYLEGRLVVNRRYQRKLVWTKEEKVHLIDTMLRRYPMPLILLAEIEIDGIPKYEIIDGMQRLNAIFSFIENKFQVRGTYFDLATMASAKQLLDEGLLVQKTPIMGRNLCVQFANYKIPISTYKIDRDEDIEEIFRRINAYGRRLSNQEIRQAGVTGPFADLVRDLAAEIRGDVSHNQVLLLNDMDKISITNRELDYGIKVEDVYWVTNGILRKEDVRDSRDEEIIADLIAFIAHPPDDKPPSHSQLLDEYYGRPVDSSDAAAKRAQERKRNIDLLVSRVGTQLLKDRFLSTHDFISNVLTTAQQGFKDLVRGQGTNDRLPRYYQVIFWAIYELLFVDRKRCVDINGLIKTLGGIDRHIRITSGGKWSRQNRTQNVNSVKGMLDPFFAYNPDDPVAVTGVRELENLLTRSTTEAASYDFKQGLHRLDESKAFDHDAFEKILETICAMANLGKNKVGYIVLGVADKEADARRVRALYGVDPIQVGHFFVVGVDREAMLFHTNVDKYLQLISNKIIQSQLSDEIRLKVASSIEAIDYNGRTVFIIKVEAGTRECFIGDRMYKRVGSQTVAVSPREIPHIARLFQ